MNQSQALDILKLGHNVYLTGAAGSGKTFLLNKYINFLKSKGIAVGVTASTGIAATHMNGMTIHSWSGMGVRDSLSVADLKALTKRKKLVQRFNRTKVLIIDEASMLHPFQLDLLNQLCQEFKQDASPFGGLQIVLCGDFFQLPPISKDSDKPRFLYTAIAWQNMDLKICYLAEQHRQTDDSLNQILNDIRTNQVGEQTLEPLRKRYRKNINGSINPTKLNTHNINVELINDRELQKLPGQNHLYNMESSGNRQLVASLQKSCLAPEELKLKKDSVVMFVKNNFDNGYVNGTLGKVIDFDHQGMPIVKTFRGKDITVVPESWTIEEEGVIKAEIRQLPLRLAWAITIHKSQGMTLDAAEVDLSKSFVEGMGYVALSRVRSLDGLKLTGLNDIALQVNQEVLNLDKTFIKESLANIAGLKILTDKDKTSQQKQFLESIAPTEEEQQLSLSTYKQTKLLIEKKLPLAEIAKQRDFTIGTIVNHLEKLIEEGESLDLSHLGFDISADRLQKIKVAFAKTKDDKLSLVKELLGDDFSYDELRLARLFLSIGTE